MIGSNEIDTVLGVDRLEAELGVKIDSDELDEILAGTPADLTPIAHYAAIWGISDDGYRAQFIETADKSERQNLKSILDKYDDALDEWLAGPEASGPEFSEAYIAFSCMRMASDEA